MTDAKRADEQSLAAPSLHLAGDDEADELLSTNPFALVVGMLLDQQVPMEKAFVGPHVIATRLGGPLDPASVAAVDALTFAALVSRPPAVHRFPGSMAARIQRLAEQIVERYDGDVEAIWRDGDAYDVRARLERLPGFGPQKARIFLALLGKQYGVRPEGWREASAPWGEDGSRISVADVTDAETLGAVREAKRADKVAKKTAQAEASPAVPKDRGPAGRASTPR